MTSGRRKVPSKTFHFGPHLQDDLEDLFGHHLVLAGLLEASTGIVAGMPPPPEVVSDAILRADEAWCRLLGIPIRRSV
jgi:hypothetical protein